MTDARGPWNEVGDRLGALALKLKLHAQEELSEERRAEATSAVLRFTATIQGAVEALGDAARDPAVKADAKAAGEAFTTAVTATVDEVLKVFRSPTAASPPGGDPPPADPPAAGGEPGSASGPGSNGGPAA